MAKIKFNLKLGNIAELDRKMREATKTEVSEFWDNCVRAFIDGVLDNTATAQKGDKKIETGMSMASLIPLAEKVHHLIEVRSAILSGRRLDSKKGHTTINKQWRPQGERSMSAGEAAGKKAYKFKKNYSLGTLEFSFQIRVYQHARWEGFNESLEKGRLAMLEYMKSHKKDLNKDLGKLYRKVMKPYFNNRS